MKLDISKAISQENREFREKVQIDMDTFESKQGDFPILAGEPFDLTIVNEDSKRLRLSAETEVTIQMPCDRCLETVEVPFSIQIDKELPLQSEYSDTEEKEFSLFSIQPECPFEVISTPPKKRTRYSAKNIPQSLGKSRHSILSMLKIRRKYSQQ